MTIISDGDPIGNAARPSARGWRASTWLGFGKGWGAGPTLLPVAALLVGGVLYVPAALAFPHRAQVGSTSILSEVPVDPNITAVLARADRLLAASPLNEPDVPRTVVLTRGGWRWHVLSLGAGGAIALRRAWSSALIFNRSDVAADRVTNGAPVGGVRSLSGTVAHEFTHKLVADRIGEWRLAMLPAWKREGYADYVARETSVGAGDEERIRAADPHARVLTYYQGRRRVAAVLARNGGSVDRLLAE